MTLMVFVNDAAGLYDIPAWLGHADVQEDRLGFADTVFPTFLFISGLSIPMAIRNRQTKGDSLLQISLHIVQRSIALQIMGVFHVNMDAYSSAALLPRPVWEILVTVSFFLIWLQYPRSAPQYMRVAGIVTGIVLLGLMALMFKGGSPESPHHMQTSWWGILGIIGRAYLVCAFLYLMVSGRLLSLLIVLTAIAGINICAHTGHLPFEVPLIGEGSSALLVMFGIVTSTLYNHSNYSGKGRSLEYMLLVAGITLIISGLFIRPFSGGISKIYGTPAWVFICSGISILVFALLIWVIDKKNKQYWFRFIMPAGSSTLTCYLLPYLLYALLSLISFQYPDFLNKGAGGLLRSLLVSLGIVWITGLLERRKVKLKI